MVGHLVIPRSSPAHFHTLLSRLCVVRMPGGVNRQLSTGATRSMLQCSMSRRCPAATTPRSTRSLDWNETHERPNHQGPIHLLARAMLSYVDYSYDEPPSLPSSRRRERHRPLAQPRLWPHSPIGGAGRPVLQEMAVADRSRAVRYRPVAVDLPRVFDPAFAADHGRGRDYSPTEVRGGAVRGPRSAAAKIKRRPPGAFLNAGFQLRPQRRWAANDARAPGSCSRPDRIAVPPGAR